MFGANFTMKSKKECNKENVKPKRGIRNPKQHKHVINKLKREKGQEYTTTKGNIVPAKCFEKVICKCRDSCHITIDENQQREIFNKFYDLPSWNQKTTFLLNNIESKEVQQRRKPENRKNMQFKKNFSRKYVFGENKNKVCKVFFRKVLQISDGRIEKCIKKKQMKSSACTTDLRGKHSKHKKTPAEAILHAIKFINSLPKYESHYTRNTTQKKYLAPNLSFKILYDEYKKQCDEISLQPISKYMFRDTFRRKFNLSFKQPSQDTCDYCNKMELKIKAAPLKSDERISLIKEKSDHLVLVDFVVQEYKEYVNDSKISGGKKVVLVFDLEKVFETPKLSTNSAYYKRQLSTYNLCIHDATNNRTYMYVWHEAIASKGPQEIASCLIHHFDNFLTKDCDEVILYSDSCGGQNRSIKMSVALSHYLEKSTNLKKITQQFFRTGHSYNVCDRKFAIIEKKRKRATNIFVPSQWKELIEEAKTTAPKFNVIEMAATKFFSTSELLAQFCTNRKVTVEKTPINWFTFRKITYEKNQPLMLHIETYDDIMSKYDRSTEFQPNVTKTILVQKRAFNHDNFIQKELPILYPNGKPISTEKKADLVELLKFIPPNFHKFYTNLNHTDNEPEESIVILSDGEEEDIENE